MSRSPRLAAVHLGTKVIGPSASSHLHLRQPELPRQLLPPLPVPLPEHDVVQEQRRDDRGARQDELLGRQVALLGDVGQAQEGVDPGDARVYERGRDQGRPDGEDQGHGVRPGRKRLPGGGRCRRRRTPLALVRWPVVVVGRGAGYTDENVPLLISASPFSFRTTSSYLQ